MPTISIFFGIVVQMYWRDHPPAHIHAAVRIVRGWVESQRAELMANWERARLREPLEAVPGADQ